METHSLQLCDDRKVIWHTTVDMLTTVHFSYLALCSYMLPNSAWTIEVKRDGPHSCILVNHLLVPVVKLSLHILKQTLRNKLA